MRIYEMLNGVTQYISEAFIRIFSPSDDAYPAIGVQPFSGEPFNENQKTYW